MFTVQKLLSYNRLHQSQNSYYETRTNCRTRRCKSAIIHSESESQYFHTEPAASDVSFTNSRMERPESSSPSSSSLRSGSADLTYGGTISWSSSINNLCYYSVWFCVSVLGGCRSSLGHRLKHQSGWDSNLWLSVLHVPPFLWVHVQSHQIKLLFMSKYLQELVRSPSLWSVLISI